MLVRTKQTKTRQACLYSLTASQMGSAIVAIVLLLVQCLPVQVSWNLDSPVMCLQYEVLLGYERFLEGGTHLLVAGSNA